MFYSSGFIFAYLQLYPGDKNVSWSLKEKEVALVGSLFAFIYSDLSLVQGVMLYLFYFLLSYMIFM